jgi:hypothetical protein
VYVLKKSGASLGYWFASIRFLSVSIAGSNCAELFNPVITVFPEAKMRTLVLKGLSSLKIAPKKKLLGKTVYVA